MMLQLSEMETYLTPDMSVYSSLIETGFSYLLFGNYPHYIRDITIIEEFIEQTVVGSASSNKQADYGTYLVNSDEDLRKAIKRTEFIQQAYSMVKVNFSSMGTNPEESRALPVLIETTHSKMLKKSILNRQLEEEKNKLFTFPDSLVFDRELQKMGETAAKNDVVEGHVKIQKGEAPLPKRDIFNENDGELQSLKMKSEYKPPSIKNLENLQGSTKSISSKLVEIDELIDSPDRPKPGADSIFLPRSSIAFRDVRSGGNLIVIKSCVEGKDARVVYCQLVDSLLQRDIGRERSWKRFTLD